MSSSAPQSQQEMYLTEVPLQDCTCHTPPYSASWLPVKPSSPVSPPSARGGHSSTYIPHLSSVVIFGGSTRAARFHSDVYLYNLITNTWSHPATSSIRPPPRSGHTALLHGNMLLVYGGQHIRLPTSQHANPTVTFYSDVWQLDLTSFEWRKWQPVKGSTSPSRNGHTAWLRDGSMWVVGGSDENGPTSSLWRLKLDEWRWHEVGVDDGECGAWDGRELHGMAVEDGGELVWLCGGRSENGVLNTRHELELTDSGARWRQSGSAPARCAHSLLTLQANEATATTQPAASSEEESKQQLTTPAIDLLSLTQRASPPPSLLLFGGTDGLTFYNDLTLLAPPTASSTAAVTVCPTCNGPLGCHRLGGGGKADNQSQAIAPTDDEAREAAGSKKGKKGKKRDKSSGNGWPAHRFAHSLTAVRLRDGRAGYLLFGGMDEERDMNDAYVLTIELQQDRSRAVTTE